ncbi:MAG: hypothetical protein PVH68_14320, partial [Armatimonadota bacterium]
ERPYLVRKEWRGATCDQTKRDGLVVRTQAEWERVWALVAKAEDAAAPPSVDFERDMALVAFAGENWRGRTVKIEDVWEEDDGLHVRVARGDDDAEAEAPYHIIVVSSYEGDVVWK